MGRLTGQSNTLGEEQSWTYDGKGRLINRNNSEQDINYAYDAKGRLVSIDYGNGVDVPPPPPAPTPVPPTAPSAAPGYFGAEKPPAPVQGATPNQPAQPAPAASAPADPSDQKVSYEYDEKGRVSKVSTPTASIGYSYDDAGRVISKQFIRGASERLVRYTYSPQGAKASVALLDHPDPKGPYRPLLQTNYHYDTLGRLASISAVQGDAGQDTMICTYQYDGAGRMVSRQFGNGITGKYQYDAFGRQTRLELSGGPLGDPLLLTYSWDNAGQVTSRRWNNETQFYDYDPAGQLKAVSAIEINPYQAVAETQQPVLPKPQPMESYTYDLAGNIVQKTEGGRATTMTYNAGNELVTSDSGNIHVQFTYDKAGRIAEEAGANGSVKHTYGYLDKVLGITKPDNTRSSFDYWPDGQLAAACDDPGGHQQIDDYIWDGLALIYVNGESDVIEPHPNGGSCVARIKKGQISYDINDLLGTTLAVVSDTELKLTPLTAFGKPKSVSPNPGTPAPLEAPVAPPQNPNLQQQNTTTK